MSPLNCDTNGVRHKNYRVWLLSKASENWANGLIAVGELFTELNKFSKNELNFDSQDKLSTALALFDHVGECRADSIEVNGEKGNSIEGNESGELVLNKACSFSAELINSTLDNIEQSVLYDKKETIIILEEVDSFENEWNLNDTTVKTFNNHEIVIIGNSINGFILNVNESHKGQGVSVIPLSIAKTVSKISSFRNTYNVEYNVNDLIVLADIYTTVNAGYKTNLATYLASYDDELTTVNIPVSAYMMFVEAMYRLRHRTIFVGGTPTGNFILSFNSAEEAMNALNDSIEEWGTVSLLQSEVLSLKDLSLTTLSNPMFGP